MKNKPVELLISPKLVAEDFNDDILGRTLDKLSANGLEEIFIRRKINKTMVILIMLRKPPVGYQGASCASISSNTDHESPILHYYRGMYQK